jgi:hypothetical protein
MSLSLPFAGCAESVINCDHALTMLIFGLRKLSTIREAASGRSEKKNLQLEIDPHNTMFGEFHLFLNSIHIGLRGRAFFE